jgi:hypothetical protein
VTPLAARRRAGILLYCAVQFLALVTVAMVVYAGGSWTDPLASGYDLAKNFLSDLGATKSWAGTANHPSAVLFSIALGSIGLAFIAFAPAWRAFAFARGKARAAGIASQIFGTLSGAAFVAVACTPVNLAIDRHNQFVICAFGFLLAYAAMLTLVQWRNGAPRVRLVASVGYLLAVTAYFASVMYAVHNGVSSDRGHMLLVVSQKAIVAVSMLYVAYMGLAIRRQLHAMIAA